MTATPSPTCAGDRHDHRREAQRDRGQGGCKSTLPEPGGNATFTVTVTNPVSAVEPIKLTGLVDSVFGNLNGDGDCDVPQDLAPSATYTCTFTGPVAGNGGETHTNEVTGTAQDNDENTVTGKDTADVKISDVVCSPVTQTDGDADSVGWGAGAGAGSRAGGCFTTAGNTSIRRREPNLPDSDPRPSPG